MSGRSGVLALVAALICALVAGNQFAVENLAIDDKAGRIIGNGVGLVQWNLYDLRDDFLTSAIAGLATFLVVVTVLGTIAGGARKPAALVGGWGAAIGAGMASGVVRVLVLDFPGSFEDKLISGLGNGAVGALPFAWLIAIAVAIGARTGTPTGAGAGTPPPGPASSEQTPPQPVWQAPAQAQSVPVVQPAPTSTDPTTAQPGAAPAPYDPTQVQPPSGPTPYDPTQAQPPAGPARGPEPGPSAGGFTIGPPPERRS